ncbi:tetratricopeptide repeat protein [Chitinophaga sp. Cy-1792]|uniref:tetratricopeptide repeat protein n=1 Tax=Chitinophaga sp. Cy-1792 TaxID=2608339 RepID=UPI00141F2AB4|nr:tetratricopeptide repeat protein [Chitinophaga sp. Cy-1792]NIG53577.1 tetratricopeptide repeat protein [Chitinophaga sp. Cy-1792]
MLSFWSDYYYLVILLNIACIVHAIKSGNREAIYLLIFLPGIGAAIYFFMEIMPDISNGNIGQQLLRLLSPNGRINEWEKRVRLSDTVTNRMQLAEAYAGQKHYDKAVDLAQSCATSYPSDQGILLQLSRFQFMNQQYAASIASFDKLNKMPGVRMNNVADELMYAQALEATAQADKAEQAYQRIIQVHHSLEAMYHYGIMLRKQGRNTEAKAQFERTKAEFSMHPRYIRRTIRIWVWLSRKELATLKA